jgi:hypothetical protein
MRYSNMSPINIMCFEEPMVCPNTIRNQMFQTLKIYNPFCRAKWRGPNWTGKCSIRLRGTSYALHTWAETTHVSAYIFPFFSPENLISSTIHKTIIVAQCYIELQDDLRQTQVEVAALTLNPQLREGKKSVFALRTSKPASVVAKDQLQASATSRFSVCT